MRTGSIEQRLRAVEITVERLSELPARVEGGERQILQLRTEMRDGFSALHRAFNSRLDAAVEALETKIREGDEETRRYLRVLHEDVISRIATLGEGAPHNRRARKNARKS